MSRPELFFSAATDKGTVKEVNQDSIIIRTGKNKDASYGLFAVADGMGGHAYGEVASKMACDALDLWWEEELPHILDKCGRKLPDSLDGSLHKLFCRVNNDILCYSSKVAENVGTTLTVLFIYNSEFVIKHIGDSRIYRINKRVQQLTLDHTWVSSQVSAGNLTCDEARNHPKRNVLTQCIGIFRELNTFTSKDAFRDGDVFIIGSDGFYDKLNDFHFLKGAMVLRQKPGYSDDIAKDLISFVKMAGERDNISLILVYPKLYGLLKFFLRR
ncbi:MAG TPA: protein phosphatase 2C domain-containing protein [Pseudobacteroides sp.]|uniref:PP2C family protein-serine/threonine phosphatase n=1 Tax=Pseudobacteroides sp. TaxID=1968840 RepID=UPI002F9552A3